MSEGETTSEATDATSTAEAPPQTEQIDWQAKYNKLEFNAQKWEKLAKANQDAAKELERVRQESMSDLDKAVAAATAQTRATTLKEIGGKLVFAEVKAAAAGRPIDVDALVDGLDPARFLTEDGDPDTDAIKGWVDKIVPAAPEPTTTGWFPDLGQGSRGQAPALNSSQLEKDLRDALKMH